MRRNWFIGIAGNIGAGKSTLTQMLSQHFGWQPFLEANAENPYLADFYGDMERWSFHSQVFFLGKRLEHHRQLVDHAGHVIQDRTVYEDAEVFARNLYLQGKLSERDYQTYHGLYTAIASFLPPPHLIIYLDSHIDTLLRHINKRGRTYERDISPVYLAQLNELYAEWIENWSWCPVLRVDNNALDFEHRPDDFAWIVREVERLIISPERVVDAVI